MRLTVSTDFDELLAVSRANRGLWESLLPVVDPGYHRFGPDMRGFSPRFAQVVANRGTGFKIKGLLSV